MEIEINDKTNNYLNSINYDFPTNNSQNNGDNNTDPIDMEKEKEINLFSKNKKSIYALNQSSNKKNKKISPGEFTLCEGRLLNDLAEFKTSKITGIKAEVSIKAIVYNFAFSSPSSLLTSLPFSKSFLFPINIILTFPSTLSLNCETHKSTFSKLFLLVIS